MAAGMPVTQTRTALAYWSPDTVRWGPVWSGVLVTLGINLVLLSIGIGSAFAGFNPASATYARDISAYMAIWFAGSLFVALFFGGWVAGRTGALEGMRAGWYQGTIVWALALLFSTLLTSMMLSGAIAGVSSMAPIVARAAPPEAAASAARTAASAIAYAAWIFLIASVLQWAAAALGGTWGAAGKVQTAADEVT